MTTTAPTREPHPIADIICAWANGFRVEFRYRHHNPGIPEVTYLSDERWHLCGKGYSAWSSINEHRIHADDLAAWEAFKRPEVQPLTVGERVAPLRDTGVKTEISTAERLGLVARWLEGRDQELMARICRTAATELKAVAAAKPYGWLYDWTHSSALGKPDEDFTSFTTDENYARSREFHRNVRACYLAPRIDVENLMTKIQAFGLACHLGESGELQIEMQEEIRAILATAQPTEPVSPKRGFSTPWGEADDSGERAESSEPVAEALPHPGSPEASAMIDSVLDEYQWPTNTKNAARAGYVAAGRLMQWARKPLPDFDAPSQPAAQGVDDIRELAERAGMRMNLWSMGAASLAYSEGCEGVTREHLEKFAELIRAAHAPAAEPQWQPIETAPTDGRKLMLSYRNRNDKTRTVLARWVTDDEAAETDADGVGLEGGWYECIDNWDEYSQVAIHEGEPSHWMPLPAAPTAQTGG